MPLIFQRGSGPRKAADYRALARSLPLAVNCFLVQALMQAAEGDYSIVTEMYAECANVWNDAPEDRRRIAGQEAEERYFSVEALERLERELAQAIANASDAEKTLIVGTNDNIMRCPVCSGNNSNCPTCFGAGEIMIRAQ